MPRVHHSEAGLETGAFSPHQVHPETALRLSLGVTLGGLGKQGRSLQTMITKYDTALVIMGARIEYARELTFFPDASVRSEAEVGLRDDGNLLLFHVRHFAGGAPAVLVDVSLRPIALTGGPALDAVPAPVPPEVREMFDSDEIVPTSAAPARYLRAATQRLEADAERMYEGERPLFIGRTDCEFADQWLAARLPSLVASAREELLFAGAGDLAVCVERPVVSFAAEFYRPMFFGDRGQVQVTVYRTGKRTTVVHRVLGPPVPGGYDADRPLCALAVEDLDLKE
jgi:acyl-CoA thioesterase FadM